MDDRIAPGQLFSSVAHRAARVPLRTNAAGAGIADLVEGTASFGEIIRRDAGSRLHLVAAGKKPDDGVDLLASGKLITVLQALSQSYESVLMSAGVIDPASLSQWARLATRAVLVAREIDETLERHMADLRDADFGEIFLLVVPEALPRRTLTAAA